MDPIRIVWDLSRSPFLLSLVFGTSGLYEGEPSMAAVKKKGNQEGKRKIKKNSNYNKNGGGFYWLQDKNEKSKTSKIRK